MKPAERMKIPREPMPALDPVARSTTFNEVNLGLAEALAIREAQRCLDCKEAKCVPGCPVQVDIPAFVSALARGDLNRAADVLLGSNALPGISGRVCPQERQCEAVCIRSKTKGGPVAIGYLERFVADWAREHRSNGASMEKMPTTTPTPGSERTRDDPDSSGAGEKDPGRRSTSEPGVEGHQAARPSRQPTGFRIAIVGSGPAGLTAAGQLARLGHDVTIFEALHEPGGVLVYGIPEFRLPKVIVHAEVDTLRKLGVKIVTNVIIGRSYTIDDLLTVDGFHAVFIANGAGLPVFMNLPGEELKGVYSANEFLTRVNLMRAYDPDSDTPVLRPRKAVVIGGGNTAMDAVRTSKRLGANPATLVYRRSRSEMPARKEEVQHAEEEGIVFEMLTNPIEILADADGWVRAVRCQRMGLGEPDKSGRPRPVPIVGSEFDIECDVVIEAVGTRANPLLTSTTPDLKTNEKGYITIDTDGMTSKPGVFAGGDIVRGAATVILAMGDGKRAAVAIDRYLRQR